MNCKVIVNTDSGNCSRLDLDKLLKTLGCVNTEVETINSGSEWSSEGYDTVIVCGGDGTLRNAIEKCLGKRIVYAPCGTLNETAHTDNPITVVGKVNDKMFSYVCAAGSFTEIGYSAKNSKKKRFKAIAYLPEVLKSYRCCDIKAKLNADGKKTEGAYTLIMVLKSHRCFGFNFNKSYKKNKGLYLLTVKSAGKDCLINRIKMFFPLFRVFFCGVKKPVEKKRWALIPFKKLTVTLDRPQNFCLDGEKCVLQDRLQFDEHLLEQQITVVKTPFLRLKRRRSNSDKTL